MGQDSIEWSRPQNIICRPSDELKMNWDGFLDCSDDAIWFDIVLKMAKDNTVQGTDEVDEIESNGDVTGSYLRIWGITFEN